MGFGDEAEVILGKKTGGSPKRFVWGIPRSPPSPICSPDLVFQQPILVVPDRAALLAQAGDHHAPCFHVLHIIRDRQVELQLLAPDAEIDPSLEGEKLFLLRISAAAKNHIVHVSTAPG